MSKVKKVFAALLGIVVLFVLGYFIYSAGQITQ